MQYPSMIPTLLLGVLCLSSTGCTKTSSCNRDEDSETVMLNNGLATVEGNTYHSAPFGGPYQYFPPNRTISFEHGLGTTPYSIQFWLAFTKQGTLAPSAGNMTELRNLGEDDPEPALDDKRISVRNNTCSDFWLWVVATRPSP